MSIPDYQSLMLPVLRIAAKGETSVPIAEAEIAEVFALTQEEREQMLPSGKQRVLHNRIHWAKFYLTKEPVAESGALAIGRPFRLIVFRLTTRWRRDSFRDTCR
jgi:restriction system protein